MKFEISDSEALVLFDWLARFNKAEDHRFEDPAEERVLWNLEALLEKQLVAPLAPNYDELLAEARTYLRD